MSVGKNVRSLAPKNPMGRRVVVTDAIDADASQGVLLVRALDGSNNYRTKTTLAVTDYPGSNLRFPSGEGSDDDDDEEEDNVLKKPVPQTGAYGHTHTVLLLAQLRVLARIWLRSSNQSGQPKTTLHLYPSNLGTVHRLSFATVCDSIVLRQKAKKSDKRLSLQLSRYEDVDQLREYYEQSWALATYGAAITLPHVTDAEAKSSFPLLFWLIIRTISGTFDLKTYAKQHALTDFTPELD